MATITCKPCLDHDHEGLTYCGTYHCDCCGTNAIWVDSSEGTEGWYYEGYSNYETWRVALWLQFRSDIFDAMVNFLTSYGGAEPYYAFVAHMLDDIKIIDKARPDSLDGVHLLDEVINVSELEEMMAKI